MISDITVEATLRTVTGSAESRRIRRQGMIPATIYGDKQSPLSVAVNTKQMTLILRSESGHNTIFKVNTPNESPTVMIKEWAIDPIKGKLMHADLFRISLTEKQRINVPLHLEGEAVGTKTEGGILEHILRSIDIECLPTEIPEHITINISHLHLNDRITVKDIHVADGIRIITASDQVVVAIIEPEEEEAVAAPAEPVVIKKGKEDKEK